MTVNSTDAGAPRRGPGPRTASPGPAPALGPGPGTVPWIAAALAITGLALLIRSATGLPPGGTGAAALALILALLALLLDPGRGARWWEAPALALVTALVFLLLVLATGSLPLRLAGASAVSVFALTWLLCALARALAAAGPSPAAARAAILVLALSLTTAPLWAGPWLELYGRAQWPADTLVALNPLTLPAVLLGQDFPRWEWFYQHSALGSLAYRYPPAPALLAAYLCLAALLSAGTEYRRRRRAPGPHPPVHRNLELGDPP